MNDPPTNLIIKQMGETFPWDLSKKVILTYPGYSNTPFYLFRASDYANK